MNAEIAVIDQIDQLERDEIADRVDWQLGPGPHDDYNADYYDKCSLCGHDFHGLVNEIGCPGDEFATEAEIAAFRESFLRPRTRTERPLDPNQGSAYTIADIEAMRGGYSRYRPPRDGAPWAIHDSQISETHVSSTAGGPIHHLPAHRFWSCSPDGHLVTVQGVLLLRSYTKRIGSVTLDLEVIDAVIDFDTIDPEFSQTVGVPLGSVVLEELGPDEWDRVAMCDAGGFELEDNRDAIVGFGGEIVAEHARTYATMTVPMVSPGSVLYQAIGGCLDW